MAHHHSHVILTEHQKMLIRTSWEQLEPDMTDIGKMVFLRIFNQNPRIKMLFPFRNMYGNDLVSHHTFSGHAYR